MKRATKLTLKLGFRMKTPRVKLPRLKRGGKNEKDIQRERKRERKKKMCMGESPLGGVAVWGSRSEGETR